MHLGSFAISAAYNKIRNSYQYDYRVKQLLVYLKHHGLSSTLLAAIENYTTNLRQRQQSGFFLSRVSSNFISTRARSF